MKEYPKTCVVGVATLSSVVRNWKHVLDGDLIGLLCIVNKWLLWQHFFNS